MDDELAFLQDHSSIRDTEDDNEARNAPLMTKDAANIAQIFKQRALLGTILSVHQNCLHEKLCDPRIYMNLDVPSSGLVCGVQGSGKSHTVSTILESALIVDSRIGVLPSPLASLVFHFDAENGGRPCEAAFLSRKLLGGPVNEVIVLVSPGNLLSRKAVYACLPGVQVQPFQLDSSHLNAARMLSMMGCDDMEKTPLYLLTAQSIMRELGADGFTYNAFKKRLATASFDAVQKLRLNARLNLVDSFLQGNSPKIDKYFKQGSLVIVDLTDPFIEAYTAALLFDICLGIFVEWDSCAKLVVLDEAHKYLTESDASKFVRSLSSLIRQQRHLALRIIISTQEPTVVPANILDLLSWIICHRFSSPSWVRHLGNHVPVSTKDSHHDNNWGERVMALRTGDGLLISPTSIFPTSEGKTRKLGSGYCVFRTRPRLTADGGASIMATAMRISPKIDLDTFSSQSSDDESASSRENTKSSESESEASPLLLAQLSLLRNVLEDLQRRNPGVKEFNLSIIGGELGKRKERPYAGFSNLSKFLEEAQSRLLIRIRGSGNLKCVKLLK